MTTPFTQQAGLGLMAEQSATSNLDYSLDWADFLAGHGGDTIASSSWTTSDPLLIAASAAIASTRTTVFLSGGLPGRWYVVDNTIATAGGRTESRSCRLFVRDTSTPGTSALFPDRMSAIASVRRDYLPALMAGYGKVDVSDAFLWQKLLAAEAHIAHAFRVPVRPTTFFPEHPTQEQIDALAGTPWQLDPGYELDPHDLGFGGIRFLKLRQVPVIEVLKVQMLFPGQATPIFTMPHEWLRLDAKYGHLQIVPIGSQYGFAVPTIGLIQATMTGGAVVPQVFHVTYRAGLENVAANYPDLVDIAMRLMGIGILKARAMPQSGSISADGLSQSYSAPDFGAMLDQIDDELDEIGQAIVGQRFGVL